MEIERIEVNYCGGCESDKATFKNSVIRRGGVHQKVMPLFTKSTTLPSLLIFRFNVFAVNNVFHSIVVSLLLFVLFYLLLTVPYRSQRMTVHDRKDALSVEPVSH